MVIKHPAIIIRKPDKRTGKIYKSISFKTLVFTCLNTYYDMNYKNRRKIVPINIGELLTKRSLAYWIMDSEDKPNNSEILLYIRSIKQKVSLKNWILPYMHSNILYKIE